MNDKTNFEDEGKELKDYWYMLFANRFLFVGVFVIVFVMVVLFTKLQKPIYQANSTILIDSKNYRSDIFPLYDIGSRSNILNNHIEMLKSRSLMENVVAEIERSEQAESIFPKEKELSNSAKISRISSKLSVIPVKDTDILKISYNDLSPYAAYFVNKTITEQYYKMNLDLTRGQLSEVRVFLQEQLLKIENELSVAEENLRKYKEGSSVVQLSEETKALVNTMAQFQERYKTSQIEISTLEKKLELMNKNFTESQKRIAEGIISTSNPIIARLLTEVANLEADYANYIAQGYSQGHPKIIEIKNKTENIRKQLTAEAKKSIEQGSSELTGVFSESTINEIIVLRIDIEAKRALQSSLGKVLNEYENKLKNIPEKELELARLERDKRVSEELYLLLRSKFEESRIAEAGKMGAVRIVDQPILPKSPILPKTKRNIMLGFFLSLIFAGGAVFVKEYIDDSIRSVDEVERMLKIKILGTIPYISVKNGNESVEQKYKKHIVSEMPSGSPMVEAYKILRTNLLYIKHDEARRSVAISSSTKGEGKSTTAINLAITMSQLDKKVLLVDADLRKPVLGNIFGVPDGALGLSQLLKSEIDMNKLIVKTDYKNLHFLPHGETTGNSTELLESAKMKFVIEKLNEKYDFVVYDTPPLLSVADPAIIARYTDGLLWVVQFKKVKKQELTFGLRVLENINTKVLGVVINNINMTTAYGNYYYYYYYHND